MEPTSFSPVVIRVLLLIFFNIFVVVTKILQNAKYFFGLWVIDANRSVSDKRQGLVKDGGAGMSTEIYLPNEVEGNGQLEEEAIDLFGSPEYMEKVAYYKAEIGTGR